MLKLTYVAVDEDHEPAVVEYATMEMSSTDTGIQFQDNETGMQRMVHYKKILKVEFVLEVPKAFVNRADNIMRLKKKNSKTSVDVTVR